MAGASVREPALPPSTTSKKARGKKTTSVDQPPQSASSLLLSPDPPTNCTSEANDDPPNSCAETQTHSSTPARLSDRLDSSESEKETFDNDLHLEQQKLIDAFNHEDEEEKFESNDVNVGATALGMNSSQSLHSWPIEKDNLQWAKTNRGKDCLIMDNFSYVFMSQSEKRNKLNFRCQRRDSKCGAVVHLDLATRSFIDTNNVNHNHPPDKFTMKQKLLNHKIEERILGEPTAVLKVIERVYAEANLTDEEQMHIRLPKTVANTFYKKRAHRYPAHPKTQTFDIPELYSMNHRGENFILYDRDKERLGGRLLIFSNPKLLSALFDSDVILCDGTFKTRPLLFQQVYVFMGRYHGETVPLVWCLTSSRTQVVYDAIWKQLKKSARRMNRQWKMSKCMVDFERAIINSFQSAFPDTDISCCWLHFVQALWRKIQKLGLSAAYEDDPSVNSWFKQFMALPLISKGIIRDALDFLKGTIPSTDSQYQRFIKYFETEWMQRTSVDLWHHGSSDMKTNNALEGYNFRLLSRFGLHPSIWEFIHYLRDEEALVSHRITHLGGGSGITSSTLLYSLMQSKRKAHTNKKHLSHLEELFDSGVIGVKEYLTSASFLVGKMPGQNYGGNEVVDCIELMTDQNNKE